MTPEEVLSALSADNITLEVSGEKIRATAPAGLKDHHRELIRQHRPELMAALVPRRLWAITEADGTPSLSSFCPPQTLEQVQERYPGASSVGPCESATQPPGRPLRASQAAMVASTLDSLGEDDPQIGMEVLDQCATDPETLDFCTSKAPKPDPRVELYPQWLDGIADPRAVVTLDDAQVREAVAAGMISRETARASVLLLVRAPKGEAGPGAVGLMAIPMEKYRDFSPMAAIEALGAMH